MALRTNQLGVLYWEDNIPMAALLAEDGSIDGQTFLSTWRTLPQELVRRLPLTITDIDAAKAKLQAVNLFVLAHRPVRCIIWLLPKLQLCPGLFLCLGMMRLRKCR